MAAEEPQDSAGPSSPPPALPEGWSVYIYIYITVLDEFLSLTCIGAQARTMGRCIPKMVLRPARNGQVTMGHPHGTRHINTFHNTRLNRRWSNASA